MNLITQRSFVAGGAVLAVAALAQSTGASENVETYVEQHPDGARIVERTTPATPLDAAQALEDVAGLRGEVLWHNTLTDAIYTTTQIAAPTGKAIFGTYLNPPEEAQLIPLVGDGTPDWTYGGTEFYVAASRDGSVLAGLDDKGNQALTVHKWSPGSGTPDWSYDIPVSATPGAYRTIDVSADGSLIAVLVTQQPSVTARLYYFDPASPTPLGFVDATVGFGRNLSVSTDGSYVAFIALADAYVVETATDSIRDTFSMGASNDPIAISGDGDWLAYGWTTLYVRQWDGSNYNVAWSDSGGTNSVKSCAFDDDGSVLAVGWYASNYLQNEIEVFDPPSSTPLWTYTYGLGSGGYQDVPYDIEFTGAGDFVAVASWGDEGNTNPEVHVFNAADGAVEYTIDTPGSMFDCDIADGGDGYVYITAGGKHVHANEQGRGGDAYAARFAVGVPGDLNGDGCVDQADLGILLASYGVDDGGDLDGDGDTDQADLGILLGNYGAGC
jgi:hypothetical protein